ncbi:hypothetical protein D3C80_1719840 [compost metagenome]
MQAHWLLHFLFLDRICFCSSRLVQHRAGHMRLQRQQGLQSRALVTSPLPHLVWLHFFMLFLSRFSSFGSSVPAIWSGLPSAFCATPCRQWMQLAACANAGPI